ncbi:MAG: hypothetical protein A2X49_02975 [Lentisphaerae bacterium GWF2_52_8]|nr:MAG: hypothetical protein A2X49_02975 [Lentisphaerae bacterium GWF2_52_8]
MAALAAAFLPAAAEARVYTGLEVFMSKYVSIVAGKRVGLVTNPTGVNGNLTPTVDLFKGDKRINLVALFSPEHGIRGDVRAGENVAGGRDPKTGLPVYTLYGGKDHRPTKESLDKIDVLVFDIQDVGSRTYTYIWHMAECMSACAIAGKPVIVLDRPNPLGAEVIDGPVTEKQYLCFIGLYPVPRVYGMTIGELARYLNAEEKIGCQLTVVPMINYRRGMSWEETGLPWVPSSPHIPSSQSACCFAATGTIGELGTISIGIGYTLPFQTIGAPWLFGESDAAALNALGLPGVRFRPIHYKPFYGAYKEQDINGVQIHVTNPATFKPTTTEVAILCHLRKYYPKQFSISSDKAAAFDKAMGNSSVRSSIMKGASYQQIAASWAAQDVAFKAKRDKYLIYK